MMTLQNKTLGIIMGGGAGARLFPLTQKRAKPAVPLGGKYRLVDIPISNCLNSGLRQVYVLTQFNSESLSDKLHRCRLRRISAGVPGGPSAGRELGDSIDRKIG